MASAKPALSDKRRAERRGRHSETVAALVLMLKGYRIIERRVRTHAGEIDLVALAPGGIVCFVEVKSRARHAQAIESLGPRQQARIARAAELYLARKPGLGAKGVRFDAVTLAPGVWPKHIRDAWRPDAGWR
jgi:putative endonuclease